MKAILFVGCVLILAAPALGQQDAGSPYVTGGVVLPYQPGPHGEEYETYVTAPGGFTLSWSIGGGVFVTPNFSIEGEFSSTGLMTAREPSRYDMTFIEERRDRFLSVASRFYVMKRRNVRLEPVIGLMITFPEAWRQVARVVFFPQQHLEVEPREEMMLDTRVGLTLGLDLRIGGPRVGLLPSLRFSQTGVNGGRGRAGSPHREISALYPGGYPAWTLRPGIALRVDF